VAQNPALNHRMEVSGGLLADECGALLRDFFAARR
jgi:tRNA(adenine34) deaminase